MSASRRIPALFVAGRVVGRSVTREAEHRFVHDEIDIFRKAGDQLLSLGERGPSLEGEVGALLGQGEEFAQGPADPEVFLHTGSVELVGLIHR
jgi:hypothetical protein